MKKILVGALVLGLVGAGVAVAVAATRISGGCCPLTGMPIHHRAAAAESVATGFDASYIGGDASAQAAASQDDGSAPTRHCCGKRPTSCEEQTQVEDKPVETPAPATPAQQP